VQRYCFALDLRPDPILIAEYIRLHEEVWPEIQKSIRDAGVLDMQIYRLGNRLFMIMDTLDDFMLERKAAMDAANPKVIEWETLMGTFQQVDAAGDPTRRWQLMEKIFQLA
jgi:L-rhamnose mutarotase